MALGSTTKYVVYLKSVWGIAFDFPFLGSLPLASVESGPFLVPGYSFSVQLRLVGLHYWSESLSGLVCWSKIKVPYEFYLFISFLGQNPTGRGLCSYRHQEDAC